MSVSVEQLIEAARGYLGVRWHHQGRSRAGVDCVGLVICVARDLGLSDYDISGYGTAPDGRMSGILREQCIEQPRGTEPAPGMLAEIRFDREPQHVAIVSPYRGGGHALLHAMSRFPRRVTEHRLDAVWRRSIVGLYRLPGVMY